MRGEVAVAVATVWDFSFRVLHLLVLLFLRQVLRALDTVCVRYVMCLAGLGSSFTAALAEVAEVVEKEENRLAEGKGPEKPQPLLPARKKGEENKLTIVLDLDETLVCAYNSVGLPPSLHNHAVAGGVRWFQIECSAQEKDADGKPKTNLVTVYERPGLAEFLQRVSEIAEVVLFTAGLEGYARPLIDRIDPENKFCARLYRTATVSTRYREHVKDLSGLGRDLGKVVLVDNNPFSFILQPENGIPCVPFTGDQPEDRQLLEVLLPLLESLVELEDVRPFLLKKYRMSAWFRNRGILTSDENPFQ